VIAQKDSFLHDRFLILPLGKSVHITWARSLAGLLELLVAYNAQLLPGKLGWESSQAGSDAIVWRCSHAQFWYTLWFIVYQDKR